MGADNVWERQSLPLKLGINEYSILHDSLCQSVGSVGPVGCDGRFGSMLEIWLEVHLIEPIVIILHSIAISYNHAAVTQS